MGTVRRNRRALVPTGGPRSNDDSNATKAPSSRVVPVIANPPTPAAVVQPPAIEKACTPCPATNASPPPEHGLRL